jgi:hypothetical protein
MKIWPIAVASLIFGWAILQRRRYPVRDLYRAYDRRRRETVGRREAAGRHSLIEMANQ